MPTRTIRYGFPVIAALGVAACLGSFTIGGTVSGLTGSGLTLNYTVIQYGSQGRMSGTTYLVNESLGISTNGSFVFKNLFPANGTEYFVSIAEQPSGQVCFVSDSKDTRRSYVISGKTPVAKIADIQVQCEPGLQVQRLAGAGIGSADGTGASASFDHPAGISFDKAGNAYVADAKNHTIRKITPHGVVTTLAGKAGIHGTEDGTGIAARFEAPTGVAVDSQGHVYVVEYQSTSIRKVSPAGEVTTLATGETKPPASDTLEYKFLPAIAVDGADNVYVVGYDRRTIRKITPQGVVSTVYQSGAQLLGLAVDGSGNVYSTYLLSNAVLKISPTGSLTVLTRSPESALALPGATIVSLKFNDMKPGNGLMGPVEVDGSGNIFAYSGPDILKIGPSGDVSFVGQIEKPVNNDTANFLGRDLAIFADKLFFTSFDHAVVWIARP